MKKVPMRMCIVTKQRFMKKDLLRVVKSENGVIVDETGKVNGHGVYLSKDLDVINTAAEKHILEHALDCPIPESIFTELREKIK